MAVTEIKGWGRNASGIRKFVCDTEDDKPDLPQDCPAGSEAYVLEPTFSALMTNSRGEWKEV